MSEILQKSIAGLFSGSLAKSVTGEQKSNFLTFAHSLCTVQSKYAEEKLIEREIELQKQKLSQASLNSDGLRDSLLSLVHCYLLGYDVSFCYIHAVKLTQASNVLNKKVGYLTSCLFLHEGHELFVLLVNSLHKDVMSSNLLEVCSALVACSYMISTEMIPSVLPSIIQRLNHPKEIVRRKAVLCLHSFLCKAPDLRLQLSGCVRKGLSDQDPGVAWAALEALHDIIQHNDGEYMRREEREELLESVTELLHQIINRKLSSSYEHHTVSAPWLTITALRLISKLSYNHNSTKVSHLLHEILRCTDTSHRAGLAVIYESVLTVTCIGRDDDLLSSAAPCVERFLSSSDTNLIYLGLKALTRIVCIDASYALRHQKIVMQCLDHTDQTITNTTLELLYRMCNTHNKSVIADKLLDYVRVTHLDNFIKSSLINKINLLIYRYSCEVSWYVDRMMKLLLICPHDLTPVNQPQHLISIISSGFVERGEGCVRSGLTTEDDDVMCDVVRKICDTVKHKTTPLHPCLLQTAVWAVGTYSDMLEDRVELFVVLMERFTDESVTDDTKLFIISALINICLNNHTECMTRDKIRAMLDTSVNRLHNNNNNKICSLHYTSSAAFSPNSCSAARKLDQRAHELSVVLKNCDELKQTRNSITKLDQVDYSLSLLDVFVSEALENGASPYKPYSLSYNCQSVSQSVSQSISQSVSQSVSHSVSDSTDLLADMITEEVRSEICHCDVTSSSVISPLISSSVSTTMERSGVGEVVGGRVREVWGVNGLISSLTDDRQTDRVISSHSERLIDGSTDQHSNNTTDESSSILTEKERERNKLAEALFSGISHKHTTTSASLSSHHAMTSSRLSHVTGESRVSGHVTGESRVSGHVTGESRVSGHVTGESRVSDHVTGESRVRSLSVDSLDSLDGSSVSPPISRRMIQSEFLSTDTTTTRATKPSHTDSHRHVT